MLWCVYQSILANSWNEWQILNRGHYKSVTVCHVHVMHVSLTHQGEAAALTHVTYVFFQHSLLQMNSFSIFYVAALSFIGPAGQLDSSVSSTKKTKWNRGRAVMSNSSYSVTYRATTVWGSLQETMEGFERSGALWSPSLIEFPGTELQCWGWLWSGSSGFFKKGG